jgi:hypothetical protein
MTTYYYMPAYDLYLLWQERTSSNTPFSQVERGTMERDLEALDSLEV